MRTFLQSCGVNGPVTLEVEGPGGSGTVRHVFSGPSILIGSHPEADLSLDHEAVSRRHAYLQVVDGGVFCVDLESRSGTHWEGGPEAAGWVDASRPFRVGPYRIRAHFEAPAAQGGGSIAGPVGRPGPLSKRYAGESPPVQASLDIVAGSPIGRTIPIGRVLTLVGQSPLCRIRLSHPHASKFHAALVRADGGVWLVDLLPSLGILVNGSRAGGVRLEDGDRLQLGRLQMRFRQGEAGGCKVPAPDQEFQGRSLVVPSGAGAMAARDRSGGMIVLEENLTIAALEPLLGQMAGMQQQMCDQFQQAMLMMSRMFGKMHGDHMEAVQSELEQIRRLGNEIRALREASDRGPTEADVPAIDQVSASQGGHPSPEPRVRRDPMEIHVLVSDRLAAYERERQSRWGNLLGILTGH